MNVYPYIRRRAYLYARRWAYRRNPLFYNYSGMGGNCTNFVSQCIYAGSCSMNFTDTYGWYYYSDASRTPSWTGVEYLYNFLVSNNSYGPFGTEAPVNELEVGDVVQLMNSDGTYYHSLVVTGFGDGEILLSAQSNDVFDRPLSTYSYEAARGIHIEGYRADPQPGFENDRFSSGCDCFLPLYDGTELVICGE